MLDDARNHDVRSFEQPTTYTAAAGGNNESYLCENWNMGYMYEQGTGSTSRLYY